MHWRIVHKLLFDAVTDEIELETVMAEQRFPN
jgi:hypothetical protein